MNRQEQVAKSLGTSQAYTHPGGHHTDKPLKYHNQLLILEDAPDAIDNGLLTDALIELGDVELVTEPGLVRVFPEITLDVSLEVMHTATLDACRSRAYEAAFQMLIDNRHHSMDGDAVFHRKNLYVPFFAALDDCALPVSTGDEIAAVGNLSREFRYNLLPVRQ